jgi:hypothetical protein
LAAFPSWVEQLIAESTGKEKKGIVPVANESVSAPEKYGSDRFFVYLRLAGDENHTLDRQVAALEANGHPVAQIDLNDKLDIGQEFFRWEFAVAAAGAALGYQSLQPTRRATGERLVQEGDERKRRERREIQR